MKRRPGALSTSVSTLLILALLAGLWASGGTALAQDPNPGSGDAQAPTVVPMANTGDGLPAGSTGQTQGVPAVGGDVSPSATGPAVAFTYYRLIGTAFQPRASATSFTYTSNGCMFQTVAADNRFQAPVLVPDGAIIKYLRLYFVDTAPENMTVWLTKYQPGVTSTDLTSVQSSGAAGYGTLLSVEITETVDLTNWAYVLSWGPGVSASTNQLCGIRIAYYAPSIFGAFMPVVSRQ